MRAYNVWVQKGKIDSPFRYNAEFYGQTLNNGDKDLQNKHSLVMYRDSVGIFFLPIYILKRILIFQRKNLLIQNETTIERLKSIPNTALKTIHFTQLHFLSSKQMARN